MHLTLRSISDNRIVRGFIELLKVLWHSAFGVLIMLGGMFVSAIPRFIYPSEPPTDAVYLYSTIGSPIILYGLNWIRRNAWKIGPDLKDEVDKKVFRQEVAAARTEIADLRQEIALLHKALSSRQLL